MDGPVAHTAANVGQWTLSSATATQCKWTKKLVDELIGASKVQRKGFWYVFTTHYCVDACTEELMNALEWNTSEAVAAELKKKKIAIKDVRDLHNDNMHGLPAGGPQGRV